MKRVLLPIDQNHTKSRLHLCKHVGAILHTVDKFPYLTIFPFVVQPGVKKQLQKYISPRVQCFVQLEIFLSEQLKKH